MSKLEVRTASALALALVAAAAVFAIAQPPPQKPGDLGFTDTPMLPGLPYHVHDTARPHPRVVKPGPIAAAPPSDAIVLFDGKDL